MAIVLQMSRVYEKKSSVFSGLVMYRVSQEFHPQLGSEAANEQAKKDMNTARRMTQGVIT